MSLSTPSNDELSSQVVRGRSRRRSEIVCVRVSRSCWNDETALSIEPVGILLANEPPPTDSAESAWTRGPYSNGTLEAGLIFDMSKKGCLGKSSQGN